ncbi:MAG: S9 family peptidase [Caldilineaceae bacterium]|nr:S9 family peptidase [Caldilineaceae bacterium]MBP8107401.1 S9 family peptidase [Caldilineaceae bacterium]MBP8124714.1 S9 family peptidase [Caldilineaceae bacterium]MBP9070944.1 S9 family peptidase [Caldilineaceae bacterium]
MSIDFARYLNIRSATTPVLAPDGARVAFLSDITGSFQVWSASVDGTDWPQQLSFFEDKVWELYGTSAASHLIAVGDVGGNERQQFYLITNFGGDDRAGHDVRRLTTDDDAIHRFGAFSKDGARIVYASNGRNGVDFDTYVMEIGSGEARLVQEAAGNRAILAWSPDERYLLTEEAVGSLQIELYLVDLTGEAAPLHLTAGADPAVYGAAKWRNDGLYLLSDRTHDRGALLRVNLATGTMTELFSAADVDAAVAPGGELEALAASGATGDLAYVVNVGGYSHLVRYDLASGQHTPFADLPAGVISSVGFSRDGRSLVLYLQTPTRNADIWTVDVASGQARQITHSDRAGIPAGSFVQPELIAFPTFDGLEIPAFYYRPQSPAPVGGYPCILYVHGGPASQIRPDFDVRFQYFLSRGYAILAPNVRGSTGYGRIYTALDELDLRMDSVADLKHAVLWLQARPEIAGDRVAIYGRSYGGFMVLAALTEYPELFAAGIDVVGIANWVTFMERTSPWRRAHREQEYGSLTTQRDLLERISPIHKIERITMPLMVIAGDNDPRVPLFESELVTDRVRAAGGSVEFLHYADEGHKISKLVNRVDSFTRMAAFLDRVL